MGFRVGRGALGALLVLTVLAAGGAAVAETVLVVQSGKSGIYRATADGFSAALARDGHQARLIELEPGRSVSSGDASGCAVAVALGPAAAKALVGARLDVPLVYSLVPNPGSLGLRGERITGVELVAEPDAQLNLLLELAPRVTSIGVIFDPAKSRATVDKLKQVVVRRKLSLVTREVRSPKDVPAAVRDLASRTQALWLVPDSTVVTRESFKFIMLTSLAKGVPVLAFSEGLVKGGAVLALSPSYKDIGRRAAELANSLIRGAEAASLGPVHPKGVLVLNSKTASKLGLSIPGGMKSRAARVY